MHRGGTAFAGCSPLASPELSLHVLSSEAFNQEQHGGGSEARAVQRTELFHDLRLHRELSSRFH